MSLTRKQAELLTFIDGYIKEHHGVAPSYDEMVEALDLNSKNGPHRLLTALEERGFIRRIKHRARAIEVLRLPVANSAAPSLDQARAILAEADRLYSTYGLKAEAPECGAWINSVRDWLAGRPAT